MGEFFKSELKDRFLQYALERRDYFEVRVLYDEFLRPNYSLDFAKKLIREIRDYNPSLLDIMSGNGSEIFMLASTPKTEDFLIEGGFLDMHVKEEEKWDTFLNQLSGSRKLSKDEKKLLKKNSPSLKREKNLLSILIAAVVVSFLFTLYSILKNAFLEPQYVPMDEFERKLEQVQSQHRLENEKLTKELEKAKAVIDSLKN
ncbi:hypothetical protein [Flagellimonas meridianipacifica]|uniref:Uncharacterized protein n=1 Tax=Flagellimonas meridianipacifica TaxID=1080225 RepID=A0A2T0M8X9_9FLAO|nr:hypothetical protein [Allomuricauda pacifica]PRX53928.1 hypothetical protein CLV81_2321 [Allomuricauda pacifica]